MVQKLIKLAALALAIAFLVVGFLLETSDEATINGMGDVSEPFMAR